MAVLKRRVIEMTIDEIAEQLKAGGKNGKKTKGHGGS